MTRKTSIDKAGRIVLPKFLRDKLRLRAGDDLAIEEEDNRITLRPVQSETPLKKEHGIWVYQGEPSSASLVELLDLEREKRIRELAR